jgi:putative membrane protein
MIHMPLLWLVGAVVTAQVALGLAPKADRMTWALENAPAWIGLVILALTHKRFPLSRLCLSLLALHTVILAVGGHYTYAKVPLGEWMKAWFGFARNHYDRIGHFAQGFFPAIFMRELLLRTSPLKNGKWLAFLVVSLCLAFSACYEFIEWWTALATGDKAADFLGTQGDPWDTQWDMLLALLGAITSVATLSRWHDRSLEKLSANQKK